MGKEVDGVKIKTKFDYKLSKETDLVNNTEKEIHLPTSNVLKFVLSDGSWFVVRPSGTEPKMKVYLSVVGDSLEDADLKLNKFKTVVMSLIEEACSI